ncbi:MAG: 4Fe-4S dicluster domain-containing protein [Anaerolineae bacterium]|nr:4Fe-4S dicluster domain-containing protein [Anaerolineae bacterium]
MYRIKTDASVCRECQACTLICSLHHEGACNPSLARLQVIKDMARYEFQILICQHCESPECLAACPSEAIVLNEQGVAVLLEDACIRCGVCAAACPYGVLFYDEARDRYLKCDLCAGRPEGPLCVAICPVGALMLEEAIAEEA